MNHINETRRLREQTANSTKLEAEYPLLTRLACPDSLMSPSAKTRDGRNECLVGVANQPPERASERSTGNKRRRTKRVQYRTSQWEGIEGERKVLIQRETLVETGGCRWLCTTNQ